MNTTLFSIDFRRRFLTLLSFKFREFSSVMGLSVLEAANTGIKYLDSDKIPGWIYLPYFELFITYTPSLALTSEELSFLLTPFDLKRLESYAQNSLDYHVILDLLPTVALFYFEKRLGNEVRLSVIQSSILLGMGLQRKSVEEVEVRGHMIFPSHPLKRSRSQAELRLPVSQALALFAKLIRKVSGKLQDIQKAAISSTIRAPAPPQESQDPGTTVSLVAGAERGLKTMEAELDAAGNEATAALREKQRAMIDALDLSR